MSQKIGTLRLALTFAGCFLGAGYVSGQELWQYFGAFGARGLLGLVLAVALLGGTGVLLLRLSARTGIETMDALIVRADIPWLRTVVGVLTAVLLFGVVCIMAAGIGALGEQMLGLPVWLGAAIACVLIAAAAYFGLGGMVSVFTVAVPCMIVAALVKTITLRPKMNRFIANKNFYQRNEISMSFVVKKQFADEAAEALAVIHAKDDSDVDSIHEDLRHQILDCKDVHKVDSSTDSMDFFNHMPRWLGKFLVWILTRLDIHGWIPASIIETDPYYTTCVISNLGSIKLNCGYHHLTNWGTCSVFCIIGEKSKRPVYHEDGTIEMREMLDLGLTIDERLADGYYYSKTIRLLKTLLENPELLETPANQEVAY